MAAIEQLVFGFAPDLDKGRQVLGSSPVVLTLRPTRVPVTTWPWATG